MRSRLDDCPDLETIATYLDGRLASRDREHVAAHVADCETCYFVLTEAAQIRRAETAKSVVTPVDALLSTGGWRSRRVARSSAAAAMAMAACLMLAVGTGNAPWRTGDSPELRALVAAVGTERPIEARLSGGFEYGPLRAVRGGPASSRPVSPDVRIAVARSEQRAMARRTPETLQSLGVGYLVMGEVERAVPLLEQAVEHRAPPAKMLSDLSAAYLVRADRGHNPQDRAKALAVADRALHADATLAEALFNRALALERLSLTDEARGAWQDFVALDHGSPWSAEARVHLDALKP
jgi:tetratricopeptide (TPR) repeat protein